MKYSKTSSLSLLAAVFALSAGGVSLAGAQTLTWLTDKAYGAFSANGNWTDEDGGTAPTPIPSSGDYHFVSPVSVGAYLDKNSQRNIGTLTITARNFVLEQEFNRAVTVGSGAELIVKEGGITVGEDSHATINTMLTRYGTATAINTNVASGGTLTFNNWVSPKGRSFVKAGAGTVVFNANSGDVQASAAYNFNEGTVIVAENVSLAYNAGVVAGPLAFSLGTASTAATLRGAGALEGRLTTYGKANSIIDMREGALRINHLGASAGASFIFDLDSLHTMSGNGDFVLGQADFKFSGGTAGEVYVLFNYAGSITFDPTQALIEGPYRLDESYGNGGWLIDGGTVSVRFAAIPEPSSAAGLAAVGVLLLMGGRRFCRRG